MASRAPRLIHVDVPSRARIEELRARVLRVRDAAERSGSEAAPRPFLVVTPLGFSEQDRLRRLLREAGIGVRSRKALFDRLLALSVPHMTDVSDASLERALAYESLWQRFFPGGSAERWLLASSEDYDRLLARKYELRGGLSSIDARVRSATLELRACLHPFHVPDRDRLSLEAILIDSLEASRRPALCHSG